MLVSHIKSLLPRFIRRPLGHVRRTPEATYYYLRGKKILRDYSRHHHRARQIFRAEGNVVEPVIGSLKHLGIRVVSFGAQGNSIDLPDNYLELVQRISESVRTHLSRSRYCSFFPLLPEGIIPEQTQDILAVQSGEVLTIQLKDPFQIKGLEDLSGPIIEELERKFYGSYVMADKVYLYRSPITHQKRQVSWLWHFDNHPHEILKVMIYLTDVSDESAPFEYLRSVKSQNAVPGSPLAPLHGDSRIPEKVVRRYLSNGFESHRVVGPAGTMILFDNNMIHRGNIASKTHRDVLIFQVRPVTFKTRPFIDRRWTGAFQHVSFNRNPEDVAPSLRASGLFA